MANINKNGNGNSIQVPMGYRFRPTDEELLLHYLKPKVHSLPLPASVIPHHFHLFQSHPSHLPGDSKEKRYFFCKSKWNNVQKCRIAPISDGSGYWKAIGKDKAINVTTAAASASLGTKKSFVFYQGTRPHALKTRWLMVEYRLVPSQTTTKSTQEPEDWVVCCIYQRKRKAKNHGICNKTRRNMEEEEVIMPSCVGMMDFMILDSNDQFGPPLPSPSYSSGNNTFSNNELLEDQEEEEEECSSNSFGPYFSFF